MLDVLTMLIAVMPYILMLLLMFAWLYVAVDEALEVYRERKENKELEEYVKDNIDLFEGLNLDSIMSKPSFSLRQKNLILRMILKEKE